MRFRLPHACLGIVLGIFAACVLAAPAAHAFTVENKDAAGQYGVPKFDLEEQAKNFRKDGSAARRTATAFTRRRLAMASCSSAFNRAARPTSARCSARASARRGRAISRQEFDRRLAPPTSLEYNGVR